MVEAVLFDLDGLMFDTEPVWTEIWKPALGAFGLEVRPGLEDACRGTTKGSLAAGIERFYGDEVDPWAVIEKMDELAAERFAQGCPKKPGLDELLSYLREHNIGRAVASSASETIIMGHLTHGEVLDYFPVVVGREKIVNAKPAPDVFLKAAELLDVNPAQCVVLEDSINGIKAGLAAGCKVIMVPDMIEPTAEVLNSNTIIARDLFEVKDLIAAGL